MKEIDEDIIQKYVMLSLMKGIGVVTQNALLSLFESISMLFEAKEGLLLSKEPERKVGRKRLEAFFRQREDPSLTREAGEIVKAAREAKIDILVREEMNYPKRFLHLQDMPAILYIKGDLWINSVIESVGIVGARRCSHTGKNEAIRITKETVKKGGAVISGLAKGIDSYAHTAALKNGGYTIAVLGNGADICYPHEHERLYESIAKNGCIMTEYPPGTMPRGYSFPRRNRLIAALSDCLYVIDVKGKSGTQTTVEYASKYGRTVTII